MKNFEKQLNNLPKARLSRTADLKIRTRIYRKRWKRYLENNALFGIFNMKMVSSLAVVLIFVLVVSVPGFAYASPGVVQGDMLYPLKRLVEQAELVIPQSKTSAAKIFEKNASRRLAEAEVLSKRTGGKSAEYLVTAVNEALANKNKATEIISSLGDVTKTAGVPEENKKTEQRQEELIKQVAQNVGLEADDRVLDSVSSMISVVTGDAKDEEIGQDQKEASSTNDTRETKKERRLKREKSKATSSEESIIPSVRREATIGPKFKTPAELDEDKKNVDELVKTIKKDDFSGQGAEKLRAKLDTRSKKTSQALNEGDLGKAEELISKSRRLMKNAKFFLKTETKETSDEKNKQEDTEKKDEKLKESVESLQGTSTLEKQNYNRKSTNSSRQKNTGVSEKDHR